MDPMTIALICAAVFGTVMVVSAFVRQLLLSRDKKLNDEAQSRALAQETTELENMRVQMMSKKRFTAHYDVLGDNRDAVKYIDTEIEKLLHKKSEAIEKYSQLVVKESGSIVNNDEVSAGRKEILNKMKADVDSKIACYEKEISELQKRRATLWDAHIDFQKLLLAQEKTRNHNLDSVYKQHAALLEKVYLRHIDDTEIVAVKTFEAGTSSFKDMLMAPIQFLMQFFGGGAIPMPSIALVHTRVEHAARMDVARAEREINEPVPEEQQQQKPLPKEDKALPEEEEKAAANSFSFAS